MSRYAVIDLGTNTCNLLIANKQTDGTFETIYDRKLPVKLGRGGIHNNLLLPEAMERGIAALQNHAITIKSFGVKQVKIIGTSALRGAINKNEFIDQVRRLTSWEIEIIDGELEAGLIFRGVKLSLPKITGKYLILDIGGGSTEFILAANNQILWKKSFNVGIARALEMINASDPITQTEINAFEHWFNEHLQDLWSICDVHRPSTIIGCSGAFDTFMDIYEKELPDLKIRKVSEFPVEEYQQIHQQLIQSDHETRSQIIGMDKMRVEMIVIASVFTNFILRKLQIRKLIHTHNSLKEGVMDWLISNRL